jgi:putative heme-binding domain-containing protein
MAPGFQTVVISLDDGKVLSGIKIGDADGKLVLADNQGNKHLLAKTRIDSEQPIPASTMPDGLERQLTLEEFVDLVGFLASQKQK